MSNSRNSPHYYPYGSTTLIAGKDKTQVQQKRYRYTGKERDDSSGLWFDLYRSTLGCWIVGD
jgi:hypothetical protein